ncbi:LLM class flavin-dependent oxidoreductase [Kineosporia succinea]|uniref:Alkanesulfonate monooxygenase SsuD/methylene tetrahydromethanopterin reductase-like flavin-dependent oxidoreductase (Luciferase family) n=1 Tax=Kineosporia succinea TaxID=84632 RepID=A0ABT9P8R3_9ACTN|nr:LLM class flavin-dependent oxidoreductase [Kineosporia succinea]MDP9829092.1 alkanesulfonate monooxygenase SsuD/methylene tetrahydromethanopterin reductase-like flavin-dependent oxidoreductase (luciferase family) [Kineosporia succinea]
MSIVVILDLAVGDGLTLDHAHEVADAAAGAGVSAIRVSDGPPGELALLDAGAVASFLAPRHPELNWIVDAPTTHNAPWNLARRVLTLDHATHGRAGLALRAGDGDEATGTLAGDLPKPGLPVDVASASRPHRWREYAQVLTGLWDGGPALEHEGRFYRVTGALDGPPSPQGRPVLVADGRDHVNWTDAAELADVLVVPRIELVDGGNTRLVDAVVRSGRRRDEVALVARAGIVRENGRAVAPELRRWALEHALDGLELATTGGRDELLGVLRSVVPRLEPRRGPTLRSALGLPGHQRV